ncbi:MAG: L-threonylcarbamoyladenylate synthase [Methyloprofundus sp.]|nr:L-threonylcarbamoyladenylate synthase [Methyloprofundus sp.]MDT8426106.1 L-threonylcarbamoyladenylate synthase [Methyloprofundus sp.]
MAQFIEIHPQNPQPRLIYQAVEIVRKGGVIVYPTDTGYALGCQMEDKQALDTIKRIRQLDDKHNFTLICEELGQISTFARVSNDAHRLIKSLTPGAFTFILDATKEVPRRMMHAKRKTIGIRIPDNKIALAIVAELGEPLLTASLILPGEKYALSDPYEIRGSLAHELDLIIDAGVIQDEWSTIISCADGEMEIIRQGKGEAPMLG